MNVFQYLQQLISQWKRRSHLARALTEALLEERRQQALEQLAFLKVHEQAALMAIQAKAEQARRALMVQCHTENEVEAKQLDGAQLAQMAVHSYLTECYPNAMECFVPREEVVIIFRQEFVKQFEKGTAL